VTPDGLPWEEFSIQHPEFSFIDRFTEDALVIHDTITQIYKHLMGKDYTLICNRGTAHVKVKDIPFCLSTCGISFVLLRFTPMDKKRLGHPLFATQDHSRKYNFGPFPKSNARFDSLFDAGPGMQLDTETAMRVAARTDSVWLLYSDTFTWQHEVHDGAYFPMRFIYVNNAKNQPVFRWWFLLDAYGYRCQ
jgi:hypothetical protein